MSSGLRLFHGGKPGLQPGDKIEPGDPHYVDGCAICDAHKVGREVAVDGMAIDPANHEPERVFVTTDREYARFYASKYPYGDLYTVDPIGDLRASEMDPFPTWHAQVAVVRGVADRHVRLTPKQRRRLMERWKDPVMANGPDHSGPLTSEPLHSEQRHSDDSGSLVPETSDQ